MKRATVEAALYTSVLALTAAALVERVSVRVVIIGWACCVVVALSNVGRSLRGLKLLAEAQRARATAAALAAGAAKHESKPEASSGKDEVAQILQVIDEGLAERRKIRAQMMAVFATSLPEDVDAFVHAVIDPCDLPPGFVPSGPMQSWLDALANMSPENRRAAQTIAIEARRELAKREPDWAARTIGGGKGYA